VGEESYIIMEYIDGFDLAQIQEKIGSLPIDVATMIAVKVLQGLVQVHSHGMIHRDIKPDNIRVTARGEVKIMDFGIALDPGEANLTQPGILIGSPHYLAPEQILGEKIDQRADLFAFGITFYEMLTGKRPFFERDGKSVYSIIKLGKFERIEKIRGDVPGLLTNIIERCLRVDPEDRPRSAEAVAQILQEYLMAEHTLSFEARIRKFLMESQMLRGNPELIEVNETTLPPIRRFSFKASYKKYRKWILLLGFLFLGAIAAKWYMDNHRVDCAEGEDCLVELPQNEVSEVGEEPKKVATPARRKTPTKPNPSLPGMPVENK